MDRELPRLSECPLPIHFLWTRTSIAPDRVDNASTPSCRTLHRSSPRASSPGRSEQLRPPAWNPSPPQRQEGLPPVTGLALMDCHSAGQRAISLYIPGPRTLSTAD